MRGVRRPPRMHQDLSGADNLTPTRQNAHMPLTVRGRRKLTLTKSTLVTIQIINSIVHKRRFKIFLQITGKLVSLHITVLKQELD